MSSGRRRLNAVSPCLSLILQGTSRQSDMTMLEAVRNKGVRRVGACIQQTLCHALAQICILDSKREMQRRCALQAVDRVDVTLFVGQDVFKYGRITKGCAVGRPGSRKVRRDGCEHQKISGRCKTKYILTRNVVLITRRFALDE